MEIEKLSNEELNQALQERGQGPFPITPSSRKVIERKLLRLLEDKLTENGRSKTPESDRNGTDLNGHALLDGRHASPSRESPLRQNTSPTRESPLRQLSTPIDPQEEEGEYDGETSGRYFSDEERATLSFSYHHQAKKPQKRFYSTGIAILSVVVLLLVMFKIVNDNIHKVYKQEF